MRIILILLVMFAASLLLNAEEVKVEDDVVVGEPISSIRYVSGAE